MVRIIQTSAALNEGTRCTYSGAHLEQILIVTVVGQHNGLIAPELLPIGGEGVHVLEHRLSAD